MSEYQFVHFLAIDRPLDDEQLEFMRRQSTRAQVTRWTFTNEYHFGDFHGNAREMLRRGYDVHLHYANFGVRRLMIRLPGPLPCDRQTFESFQAENGVVWDEDANGKRGILWIEPQADGGTYTDVLYDAAGLLPEIAPIRALLAEGDLRPLYLAWLACADADDAPEPPVPAGLKNLSPALRAMAGFYELSADLVDAAAESAPPPPEAADTARTRKTWIARRSKAELAELVERLLGTDAAAARADAATRIREQMRAPAWPLAESKRTLAEIRRRAERLREKRAGREERAREAARRKRLAAIAADPGKLIAGVEKLVAGRAVADYERAAGELVDLQEALGPERGPIEARAVAEKLRRANPRLHRLIGALRKRRLLD